LILQSNGCIIVVYPKIYLTSLGVCSVLELGGMEWNGSIPAVWNGSMPVFGSDKNEE
jgi:hypothetical protein